MSEGAFHVDFLRNVVASGGTFSARFSLHRDPLGFPKPTFYLELDQKGVRSLQQFAWSSELETYLLFEQPKQMRDASEEAERFAAVLMNNVETAGHRHGKDYAHAVLVDVLRERSGYDLGDLLDRAATARPSRNGKHYGPCREFLVQSLDGLRASAEVNLGYPPGEASSLMSAALRILLDETFHIGTRDYLFGSSVG